MWSVAGWLWKSLGIGAGVGLVSGLVGIEQWMLTQLYLTRQLAAAQAWAQQHPGGYGDATNLVRSYEMVYFGAATVFAAVMLALSWLAALMAGRASQRERGGMVAGLMAAAASGVAYFVATGVAISTSPDPDMTGSVAPCIAVLVLICAALLYPVVLSGARRGARVGAMV